MKSNELSGKHDPNATSYEFSATQIDIVLAQKFQ